MFIICWLCEVETNILTDAYGDHRCNHCGAQISVYNPADFQPERKEEMPFEKLEGNFLRLPKEGETYDYSQHGAIVEIKKVEGGKFNFVKKESVPLADGTMARVDKDLGYHYDIVFADGKKQSIGSWSPFFALQNAGVEEGVKFNLAHPEKGKWVVTIIGKEEI